MLNNGINNYIKRSSLSLLCSLLFLLSSCDYFDLSRAGPPTMMWMFEGPPPKEDGSPHDADYTLGWVHGCETGTSASTNHWYKQFYHFRQDAYKAQTPKYYKGWKDAYTYCSRYIFQWNRKKGL